MSDSQHSDIEPYFMQIAKKIKSSARIRLDLTKDCCNFLVSARKRINNCPEVFYTDINGRLKVKLTDQSHKLCESKEELNGILSNSSK